MIIDSTIKPVAPSALLYEKVKAFQRFPDSIAQHRGQLAGTSFFPAGVGLYVKARGKPPAFPIGKIMVLAHDWGTEGDYQSCVEAEEEPMTNATWRNMLLFFKEVGIDPSQCFYTNFFVGLRTSKKSVGKHPGRADTQYVSACTDLLVEQLRLQKPRLVLVLGAHVPRLLAQTSADFSVWSSFQSFKHMDLQNVAAIHKVAVPAADHSCFAVSLVHPCYRQRNARLRQWNGHVGNEAEVSLVRHALSAVGL